jgi:hypothetical protein
MGGVGYTNLMITETTITYHSYEFKINPALDVLDGDFIFGLSNDIDDEYHCQSLLKDGKITINSKNKIDKDELMKFIEERYNFWFSDYPDTPKLWE